MSGARRRSKSLWDNRDADSSFHGHGDTSPKRSNSEANDVLMSDDFSHDPMQPNENMPYRGGKDRDRSRSPHRNRTRNRDHVSRGSDERERRESYESGDMRNDSRVSSHSHRPGGSRFRDDRNKDSDVYRKDNTDYHNRGNSNSNNNRSGYDGMKAAPCRFFMMGNCTRNSCKYSHDVQKAEGYEERSHDVRPWNKEQQPQDYSIAAKSNRNLDDKNKSWNDLESFMGNQESQHNSNQQQTHRSYGQDFTQNPTSLKGDEKSPDMNNGGGKPLEASRNGIPSENVAASKEQVPSSLPEKQILANALELLYSLPNSGASGAPVSEPMSDSQEQGNKIPVESVGVPDAKQEENEKKKDENENLKNSGKNEKVEEGDEKAMRQFKIVLVEFVKEILKPTWKEGKMSREVYKTIVKKVVEKVSSSIQGVQIPRTQEKIDQYLAFSKSKITKLVEAYVGRLLKG